MMVPRPQTTAKFRRVAGRSRTSYAFPDAGVGGGHVHISIKTKLRSINGTASCLA